MSNFSTLFKYEFKKQFPSPSKIKKGKIDIVGFLLSFIVTLAIIGMFVYFLTIIGNNYVTIKIEKVFNAKERAYELLNVFYLIILTCMVFISLENMRKTLTDNNDKKILLRLPVKEQTLFLSKFSVLLIKNYIISSLLVIPTNLIIFLALKPSITFWLMSFIVLLVFPIIVFLFASLFIVPYIKLINFIKNKYILIFILLSALVAGFVLLYTAFLGVVQSYLETGHIKFLFNETFIKSLQTLLRWSYPSNCLAGIVLCQDLLKSFLVIIGCVVASVFAVYFITKKLYHVTLYKNEDVSVYKRSTKIKKNSVLGGLIKKEFISVYREPKHIFSYLVIATVMPILVYCCYTLFESLILNMLGIRVSSALALFIVLTFSVLTNTFCSTNITREGKLILKQKTLPLKASQILSAKVIFCLIVSLLSVVLSSVVLIASTSLKFWDGIFCLIIGCLFSFAQIIIATRLDLKNTNLSLTIEQIEKQSSMTIAKVVTIGLIISFITGAVSLVLSLLSQSIITLDVNIHLSLVYIIPTIIGLAYVGLAILLYSRNLQKTLDNIAM